MRGWIHTDLLCSSLLSTSCLNSLKMCDVIGIAHVSIKLKQLCAAPKIPVHTDGVLRPRGREGGGAVEQHHVHVYKTQPVSSSFPPKKNQNKKNPQKRNAYTSKAWSAASVEILFFAPGGGMYICQYVACFTVDLY